MLIWNMLAKLGGNCWIYNSNQCPRVRIQCQSHRTAKPVSKLKPRNGWRTRDENIQEHLASAGCFQQCAPRCFHLLCGKVYTPGLWC